MRLASWARTDTGRKRDHNEDSYLADDELQLWAVADGMGGHQGGGCASRMALDVLRREIAAAIGDVTVAAAAIRSAARRGMARRAAEEADPDGVTVEDIGDDDTLDGATARALAAARVVPGGGAPGAAEGGELRVGSTGADTDADVQLVLSTAARRAGEAIFETAQVSPELEGMGTTLSAIVHHAGKVYFAHAGDSRVYLFREGRLSQLTEDHSWIWEQVKAGAMTEQEARASKFRHIITRSVGFERDIEVDTGVVPVHAGDCFLLCSDGMSNYVENDELARILAGSWYRRVPQLLVDLANDRGGEDNITVIVVCARNDLDG